LALCIGEKAKEPNVRLVKIELKKICGGENKKCRRIGNEYRLTRCPVEISSVCWLSVKMICIRFLAVCLTTAMAHLGLLTFGA